MLRKILFFQVLLTLMAVVPASASTLTVFDGEDTNDYVPIYGYYADDFLKCEFIIPAESLTAMSGKTITQITWYLGFTASRDWGDASFKIFMKEVSASTFSPVDYEYSYYGDSGATVVYEGPLDGQQSVMSIPLQQSFDYQGGNLLIGVYNMAEGQWAKTSFYGVATDENADDVPAVSGYRDSAAGGLDAVPANARNFLPKTTFEYVSEDELLAPIELTAHNITSSSATLSWTPRDVETQWKVAYKLSTAESWKGLTVSVDSIDLSNLISCALYDCRVCAIKDGKASDWCEATFYTSCCEDADKGQLDYTLTDSFGDGWNGAYIEVVSLNTNQQEATITNENSPEISGSVRICYDIPYAFIWHKGSYDYECSFTFTDHLTEEVVYSISGSQNLQTGDTLFVYTLTAETYPRPEGLTVGAMTYNSATLSWTPGDDETAWQVAYSTDANFDPKVSLEGATVVDVQNTPTTTLLSLNEYTTYFAAVRSNYDGNMSEWCNKIVSFQTPSQFPLVDSLTIDNIKSDRAIAKWKPADNAAYSLRYREFSGNISEDFEGGEVPTGWTLIDADGDGYNWSIYNTEGSSDSDGNPYSFGNYTISSASFINNIGVLSPDNWLILPRTTLGGTLSYYVRALDSSYNGDLMEVYVSTTGTEVSDFEAVPNTIVCPIDQSLTLHTVDLSAYSGEGFVAFRHYNSVDQYIILIDNVTLTVPEGTPVQDWTVIEPATSPVEMTGLREGTLYEVEVQAHYPEGNSPWEHMTFGTLANNTVPTDLAAENVTDNTADATWNGANESYNLRYRVSEDDYYATDFESSTSFNDWTTFNNDGDNDNSWFLSTILNRDENGNRYFVGKKGIACYRSADTVPTTDQWAVTPEIDLGGELSFYMRNYYIGHHENFEVYLSTSGNSLNDFINDGVMLLSGSTEDVLTRYTYDLSDYEGQQGYIAFRYTGGYKVILLDDVALIKEPAGSWTVEEQVTSPYAISGLTPKTQYDMQVQGIYGENKTTEWCDIVKFTTTEDFTTLAEALAGDNGDIVIEDKLSVVVANDNYAIVSDGKGNWLKVVGNNTIGNYAGVSMLDGILSNVELNPEFYVYRFVPSDEVVDVELKHLDLRTIHRTALTELKPNEVADFMGYYNAETGELCAFSPNTEYGGLHIAMTTDNMVGAISTGKQQKFTGVVSLKEAWDAPSGAPARVASDDELAFENIQIDATAASVATGVETVKMLDGKEIEGIYNVNGQRVTHTDKGVYIIRFQDGTTQKVRF